MKEALQAFVEWLPEDTKAKYAPHGRGTIATGVKSSVGSLIQSGRKSIGG